MHRVRRCAGVWDGVLMGSLLHRWWSEALVSGRRAGGGTPCELQGGVWRQGGRPLGGLPVNYKVESSIREGGRWGDSL